MNHETEQQILTVLSEIREGQREAIEIMTAHRALAEEQVQRSRKTLDESLGLQRVALQRQKAITMIALPAIVACITAIVYLLVTYF